MIAYFKHTRPRDPGDPNVDPDTLNAWQGFAALDYETRWDPAFGTVLDPTTPLVGSIHDVWFGLRAMGAPPPPSLDYPDPLIRWLGRQVWQTSIVQAVRSTTPVFVKPVAPKAFTGFVWRNAELDYWRVMHLFDDGDGDRVWCSEVVDFRSEWRVFVHRGEVVGIRGYKGEPLTFPDVGAIRAMVAAWTAAPVAYGLDVGVTGDGRTLLVEVNDCYALGSYDLPSVTYARMLADRWREMAGGGR